LRNTAAAAAGGSGRNRSASPGHRAEDFHGVLELLDVEGLGAREVDELRSLLLLHSFAEAVAKEGPALVNRKGGLAVEWQLC
jgi:hypothetical protein